MNIIYILMMAINPSDMNVEQALQMRDYREYKQCESAAELANKNTSNHYWCSPMINGEVK